MPERTARTSETTTLVVPSHRETLPLARITWFPSALRHRAKIRPQDELHIPRLVLDGHEHRPVLTPGKLPSHGPSATTTTFPSSISSTAAAGSTLGRNVDRTYSITWLPE